MKLYTLTQIAEIMGAPYSCVLSKATRQDNPLPIYAELPNGNRIQRLVKATDFKKWYAEEQERMEKARTKAETKKDLVEVANRINENKEDASVGYSDDTLSSLTERLEATQERLSSVEEGYETVLKQNKVLVGMVESIRKQMESIRGDLYGTAPIEPKISYSNASA